MVVNWNSLGHQCQAAVSGKGDKLWGLSLCRVAQHTSDNLQRAFTYLRRLENLKAETRQGGHCESDLNRAPGDELIDAFIIFYELVEADPMAAAFPPRSFECSIEDASLALVLADCLLLFKMLN